MKNISIWILLFGFMMMGIEAHAEKFKRPDTYNYQRGLEAFQNDNYDEAFEYLSRELQDNPKNGYAHTLVSAIHYSRNDFGKALSEADAALKYLPKKDSEYLCMAYLAKAGVLLVLEDTTKALSTFAEGIKRCPSDQVILFDKRAQLYYELGQYDLSDADYRKLIELEPGETLGYMGLGRNANAQERWEDAIKQFDYVTKLSSDYYYVYSFRAESYIGLKKWDEATDDIITVLKYDFDEQAVLLAITLEEPAFSMLITKLKVQAAKNPNDASWLVLMGYMYESKRQYTKAIEAYNKANERDADDATYYRLSHCYYDMGNMKKALSSINSALNLNTDDLDDLEFKAVVLSEMGDHQGAIGIWDKVIEEVPEYAAGYHQRGYYKRLNGDIDDALEDLSMAIVLEPKNAYYYNSRALIYTQQGQNELAEDDYRKVIELESKPEDYQCIPYAYLGLGDNEKAIACIDTIIARDTTSFDGYYNKACLYSRMNDKENALRYLRKSLELGNRHFGHISRDTDLDNIRNTDEFKALIEEFNDVADDGDTAFVLRDNQAEGEETIGEVPFTKEDGVCKVKCRVNDLPLYFIFDTGASDVTLSMVEATFMVKNGYLSDSDIVGSQRYMDANGNVSVGTVINLKEVDFGGFTLNNVKASVVLNQKAPLLLGQSVLGRLGKIEIDNQRQVLKISHTK